MYQQLFIFSIFSNIFDFLFHQLVFPLHYVDSFQGCYKDGTEPELVHRHLVSRVVRRLHSQNSVSGITKESTLGFYMRQYSTMGPQQQPQGHSTDPVSDHSGAEFSGTAKSYDAIPSPKRIPLLSMSRDFMKFSHSQMAHFVQGRVDNLGKIFREKLAPGLPEFLFVLDPGDVAKVFRADGKYPRRLPFSDWINVRNELNIPHGLFLS